MKRIFLLLLGLSLCACGRYGCGVPAEYGPLLDAALADCPRADSLRQLLRETPRDRRAGMAFLVAYMPQGDRDTMRLDLLRENVEYAYRARAEYPWTRALPDSVFLNDVQRATAGGPTFTPASPAVRPEPWTSAPPSTRSTGILPPMSP